MAKTWAEIDTRRESLGITKAELARDAGISESSIHKGIASDGKLRLATARVLEQVLDAAEEAQEDRDAAE